MPAAEIIHVFGESAVAVHCDGVEAGCIVSVIVGELCSVVLVDCICSCVDGIDSVHAVTESVDVDGWFAFRVDVEASAVAVGVGASVGTRSVNFKIVEWPDVFIRCMPDGCVSVAACLIGVGFTVAIASVVGYLFAITDSEVAERLNCPLLILLRVLQVVCGALSRVVWWCLRVLCLLSCWLGSRGLLCLLCVCCGMVLGMLLCMALLCSGGCLVRRL